MIRKLIIIIGLYLSYSHTTEFLDSFNFPAEGLVSEQYVRIEKPSDPSGEETTTDEEPTTDTVQEPEPEPEKPFEPLPFDGKLGKFRNKYGGEIVKVDDTRYGPALKKGGYKYKSKGILLGEDFYFAAKGGLYVIHLGKLIKL